MEKILIFKDMNCCNYWFRYVIKYLKLNEILCKVYLYSREIWINGDRILFKSKYEADEKFKIGRHNSQYYYDMEEKFEKNFIGNLGEIIYGKEGNINI